VIRRLFFHAFLSGYLSTRKRTGTSIPNFCHSIVLTTKHNYTFQLVFHTENNERYDGANTAKWISVRTSDNPVWALIGWITEYYQNIREYISEYYHDIPHMISKTQSVMYGTMSNSPLSALAWNTFSAEILIKSSSVPVHLMLKFNHNDDQTLRDAGTGKRRGQEGCMGVPFRFRIGIFNAN
jgi:hypothetical protein